MDFEALAQQCAPEVHRETMARIVRVESSFNPYAIGVVNGRLERQPRNYAEAVATARALEEKGYNYSVGIAQVNKKNFKHYGLTIETAFDACRNLKAGSEILKECFLRARKGNRDEQTALRAAFSCYYSGNFTTGFQEGYVMKVAGGSAVSPKAINVIPAVAVSKKKSSKREIQKSAVEEVKNETSTAPSETSKSALLF